MSGSIILILAVHFHFKSYSFIHSLFGFLYLPGADLTLGYFRVFMSAASNVPGIATFNQVWSHWHVMSKIIKK